MSKKYLSALILLGLLASPLISAAIDYSQPGTVNATNGIQTIMNGIVNFLWQFFAGIAVIMFVVAGVLFLTSMGDPGKLATARNAFIWGVVGIIVAIVAFSIVAIIKGVATGAGAAGGA